MEFIRFLRKESGADGARIAGVTLLGGIASGLMMIIIIHAAATATDASANFRHLILFAIMLAAILLAKRFSLNHTARLTEQIVERLRMRISDKIRRAELLYFENFGPSHFATLLTKETQLISSTAAMTINAAASAVMLVVSFLFIAYLSIAAFLLTLIAIGVAVVLHRHSLRQVNAQLHETIREENAFFDLLHHLLFGFKELKMNAGKNRDLFDHYLVPLAAKVRQLKVRTNERFVATTLIVYAGFYALVAMVVFLLPKITDCSLTTIMQVTAVILFIFGPLAEVVGIVPEVARAGVSIETIKKMELDLDRGAAERPALDFAAALRPWPFRELGLRDLAFTYANADGSPGYTLGPVSADIRAGEILFLMGGNGSGKSTLLKLLTGLYYPASGQILVDGKPLKPGDYPRYRNLFSAIFTDFHLFDRLYGLGTPEPERLAGLFEEMDLADKTGFADGRFTQLNLSTGQRKRLGLIAALLEDKPILVFDEWAADQDPVFRRHFYETILRDLKSQGKTIIAATHDDRYFHVADRVLKMDYGRFAETPAPAPPSN